jgi:predicted N-formylglutamate amidohydrolase
MRMPDPASDFSYIAPLLGPGDPPPVTVRNPEGKAKCLLICDHASASVPAKLGRMGLEDEDFQRHYTVDIGAGGVTEALSDLLDAPAVLCNYSRVVVDTNRPLDHPTAFVTSGEGKPIPGNLFLSEEDRACRVAEIYNPFHDTLRAEIDKFLMRGEIPILLAVHSFTPVFFKQKRPWEFGVLWVQDRRISDPMISHFKGLGYNVGDNQPYDARAISGTTINRHGDDRKLPNVLVEIRNDMLRDAAGIQKWAGELNVFMQQILEDESLRTLYDGPLFHYDPDQARTYFETLVRQAQQDDQA